MVYDPAMSSLLRQDDDISPVSHGTSVSTSQMDYPAVAPNTTLPPRVGLEVMSSSNDEKEMYTSLADYVLCKGPKMFRQKLHLL